MASAIYDSFLDDLSKGNVISTDTYKVLLVSASDAANKATHTKRSDIATEITGTGYTAGGTASTLTVALDTTNHKETWTFTTVSWTTATIAAVGAVIYKSRGGASSADNLIAYVDFGGTVTSTAGTYTLTFSSPLTLQA